MHLLHLGACAGELEALVAYEEHQVHSASLAIHHYRVGFHVAADVDPELLADLPAEALRWCLIPTEKSPR